jgi:uncharacterized protein YukE
MSWFTDIVQDFYNLQVKLNQATEAYTKVLEANKALNTKNKQLTEAANKDDSREK